VSIHADGWDTEDPIKPIKGESKKANAALFDYSRLGAGRSQSILLEYYRAQLATGQQPPTCREATIKTWSARYHWVARVEAWDRLERQKDDQKWEDRKEAWRERLFTLVEVGAGKLEAMIEWPLAEETLQEDDEGRPTVILAPANWNMLHAARLLAEVTKSAALVLGEPTDRSEQRHTGEVGIKTAEELPDNELNDRIHQLLVKLGPAGEGGAPKLPGGEERKGAPEQNG
jgi:hypothetical protein